MLAPQARLRNIPVSLARLWKIRHLWEILVLQEEEGLQRTEPHCEHPTTGTLLSGLPSVLMFKGLVLGHHLAQSHPTARSGISRYWWDTRSEDVSEYLENVLLDSGF